MTASPSTTGRMAQTVEQFCGKWQICRGTFYNEAKAGRLRLLKISTATRITPDAEADWIAACEAKGRARASTAA